MVFIGTLLASAATQIRLDWQTIRLMPRIARSFRGGDNRLLTGMASWSMTPACVSSESRRSRRKSWCLRVCLATISPSARDRADIVRALELIAALGPFDVGQAAVVADSNVLAVEAAEGTDNLLAAHRRIARGSGA